MILFYIRHGEPIYNPDSLTPKGMLQAESVSKRLALFGIDKIYSSTSNRAIQTAQPLCDMMKTEPVLLDFCNEKYAIEELTIDRGEKRKWIFRDKELKYLLAEEEVLSLGHDWCKHPKLTKFQKGIERINYESDEFLKSLGYEHIKRTGKFIVHRSNNQRVALFAHHGFGLAFLSNILDIPFPIFANHFELCHSGMTVIEFAEEDGMSMPRILTLSSDSHLYKDNFTMNYNNRIQF